jgi:hypothetical protein
MTFWKMLKISDGHFEATHLEPKVEVCNRRYAFDADHPRVRRRRLCSIPLSKCLAFVVNPKIGQPALEKQRTDEVEYAQLVKDNVSVVPIYGGLDGGMNTVFVARGSGRPARGLDASSPIGVGSWRIRFALARHRPNVTKHFFVGDPSHQLSARLALIEVAIGEIKAGNRSPKALVIDSLHLEAGLNWQARQMGAYGVSVSRDGASW